MFIPGRKGESTAFKNNSFWQGIIYSGIETPKRSNGFNLKMANIKRKLKNIFKITNNINLNFKETEAITKLLMA